MCDLSILHPIDSMSCIGTRIVGGVGSAVTSAFSTVFGGIVTWLSGLITDAIAGMIKTLGTFWVKVGTPGVGDVDGNPSSTISWMWAHLRWYTLALLVFSVLLGAGRMALARRAEPGTDTLRSIVQYSLVSTLGVAVVAAGIEASDLFSTWIITASTGSDFTTSIGNLLNFGAATGTAGIGLVLLVVLGLLAVLASIIQIVLMVMRSAMLVLLISIGPLAAAATNTEMGKQWFRKVLAWTIAFLLYKPVASIIYALAFRLMSSTATGGGLVGIILGIAMMIMALLGLPALMRFLVPAVAATAGGAGAGAMAAGAIATGAMLVAGGGLAAAKGAGGAAAAAGPSGSTTGTGGTPPPGGGGGGGGGSGLSGSGPSDGGGGAGGGGGPSGSGPSGGGGGAEGLMAAAGADTSGAQASMAAGAGGPPTAENTTTASPPPPPGGQGPSRSGRGLQAAAVGLGAARSGGALVQDHPEPSSS